MSIPTIAGLNFLIHCLMSVKIHKLLIHRCQWDVISKDFHTTNPFVIQWQGIEEFLADLICFVFSLAFHFMSLWLLAKMQPNNRYFRNCSGVQRHKHVNSELGIESLALQGVFEQWKQTIFSDVLWSWSEIWWVVGQETWLLVMDPPWSPSHHKCPQLLCHDSFIIKKWLCSVVSQVPFFFHS